MFKGIIRNHTLSGKGRQGGLLEDVMFKWSLRMKKISDDPGWCDAVD